MCRKLEAPLQPCYERFATSVQHLPNQNPAEVVEADFLFALFPKAGNTETSMLERSEQAGGMAVFTPLRVNPAAISSVLSFFRAYTMLQGHAWSGSALLPSFRRATM